MTDEADSRYTDCRNDGKEEYLKAGMPPVGTLKKGQRD